MKFIDLDKQYRLIENNIKSRIHTVLEHGQYIMGPEVKELESNLAHYVGTEHAIAVSSGTDALLLALMSVGVSAGDEVITTPFSFFASAEVIALLGAKPVFVDIERDTFNIDATKLEAAITEKTKAIMPVSLYGQCADMDEINAIADAHQLTVIEDAAQSFGAEYKGRKSCALSTIGCTSFFPSKPLGAYGDAGACFTNDQQHAEKMRQLLTHGQSARYVHKYIGLNARMDSIQAAILIEKLAILDKEIQLRDSVAKRYNDLLNGMVSIQHVKEDRTSAYAQYTVKVSNRETVQMDLKEQGIPSAVHYPVAMHEQPALSHLGFTQGQFPIAEAAAKEVISLPMHPYLEEEDQKTIVTALLSTIERAQV